MARPKGDSDAKGRLVEAAGRGFRTNGYGGAGVDALAKGAGLTSGAFYAHFESKAEAFRLVVAESLVLLRNGVAAFQQQHGRDWRDPFVDFYLGPRMELGIDEACGLPSFSSDVARADDATRAVYEAELARLVDAVANGFHGADARQRAWSLLAVLSGAAAMARAVKDAQARRDILAAAAVTAKAV
ncbi:TetR/AcrR family transcriptional regulator [Bradyrhizobium jicamae]|uniref:TetR/AcrR family transcriptional regulator n=1 Tax=Bradyrhizobium jicamae TaxID=280332 RepID=A0ABS5FFS4_9BRAD|nr:TetR/AcrR family transcriptional regulator [Bradyrhizobium jicamae]MBR0795638.1 TetR/AcrR family transcriptional regulator [Bradyrhizobium jicamae]